MGRGSDQATSSATTAQQNSKAFNSNASGIYGTLIPQLTSEISNPQGFSPTAKANLTTSAQQSTGGATAGASGRGALLAGRTRNAGTADAAIGDAMRSGAQDLSQKSVDIEGQDAELKEHQRQEGLSALQGIYGTNVGATNQALGEVAPLVNANTQAEDASWNWTKPISAISGLASSASGFKVPGKK